MLNSPCQGRNRIPTTICTYSMCICVGHFIYLYNHHGISRWNTNMNYPFSKQEIAPQNYNHYITIYRIFHDDDLVYCTKGEWEILTSVSPLPFRPRDCSERHSHSWSSQWRQKVFFWVTHQTHLTPKYKHTSTKSESAYIITDMNPW